MENIKWYLLHTFVATSVFYNLYEASSQVLSNYVNKQAIYIITQIPIKNNMGNVFGIYR